MSSFLPTIILRHRKENLKKCSLRGLESHPNLLFYTYPTETPPSLEGYVMLHLGPEAIAPLSAEDRSYGLFFLDSTWHYEAVMHRTLQRGRSLIYRSLPTNFVTAYPRQQTKCSDPLRGLATVEALYIAYTVLGRDTSHLLESYHWKEAFLEKNQDAFSKINIPTL